MIVNYKKIVGKHYINYIRIHRICNVIDKKKETFSITTIGKQNPIKTITYLYPESFSLVGRWLRWPVFIRL